jgi:putative dimethyl sulfoxide reductase chaperone
MQDVTISVLDLYWEGGFEMDEDFRALPKHISAELEFLDLLLFRQAQARRNNDPQALSHIVALQRRFLDLHFAPWFEPFAAAMAAGARTVFYRELAALRQRVVKSEAGRVRAA